MIVHHSAERYDDTLDAPHLEATWAARTRKLADVAVTRDMTLQIVAVGENLATDVARVLGASCSTLHGTVLSTHVHLCK